MTAVLPQFAEGALTVLGRQSYVHRKLWKSEQHMYLVI